jgi:hypothetical protein
MNAAHLHLVITHLPVFGVMFGGGLLAAALVRSSQELWRTSLWVFLLSGLSSIPSYLTGRPASGFLTALLPGISMDASDQHAEVAMLALVAASVLAVIALVGLLRHRRAKSQPLWFNLVVLAMVGATLALLIWTANLGGQIRHPEIRFGETAGNAAGAARD